MTSTQTNAVVSTKFAAFDITNVAYKEVNGVPIEASVLVSKSLKPGKHPVMVRWHGGGFITGARLFEEWMCDWTLDVALRNDAILIMPDYRLMPEASGLDILDDVHSFFAWLFEPEILQACLPDDVKSDLDSILATGESAGGWLALQSGFHKPDNVKAVIAHYPMVDLRDRCYTEDYEKQVYDPPAPQLDRGILLGFVENLKGDEVVSSAIPPARSELFLSMLQQGSFGKFFGDDSSLYPVEVLDKVDRVPPTWVLHGKEDSAIPIDGTYKYVEQLKAKHPTAKLHLSYEEGDHGFDNEPPATLDDDWVKESAHFIADYWPKC